MKTGHSLFIWWLLIPQPGYSPSVPLEEKLKTWMVAGELNTERDCMVHKEKAVVATAVAGDSDTSMRFSHGVCVEKSAVEARRR